MVVTTLPFVVYAALVAAVGAGLAWTLRSTDPWAWSTVGPLVVGLALLLVPGSPDATAAGAVVVAAGLFACALIGLPSAGERLTVHLLSPLVSKHQHADPLWGALRTRLSESIVAFAPLDAATIAAYANSGEGEGQAGGYAIQGRAGAFVRWMSGSYSGIVGLPLFETRALLRAAGLALD